MPEAPKTPVRLTPWPWSTAQDKPEASLTDAALFTHTVVSPLRYPGAKRQLVDAFAALLARNVPRTRLLVEPFCGGATTSLRLAGMGVVDHVVLADADPLVAAFWHVAAFDTTWLINRMREERVTVARWDWWREYEPTSRRQMALKCLFLNRTTFSGILHGRAGPIGGRAQTSDYKIDCRFGLDGLERRLRAVGELADTGRLLDVWNVDWRISLTRLRHGFGDLSRTEKAVYLDPPYVDKAPELYDWSFDSDEHKKLAATVRDEAAFRWVLSYDDNATARGLYKPGRTRSVRTLMYRYTAAGSDERRSKAELFVTNYPDVPKDLQKYMEPRSNRHQADIGHYGDNRT